MIDSELVLPQGIPPEAIQRLKLVASDPDKCVQLFFQIKNKSGVVVPFIYNRPQRLHQERGKEFDIVLKARKMGISSRRIALDIWKCATRRNQHRIALTHTGEAVSKMLSERVVPFIRTCKFPLGAVIRNDHIYFPLVDSRYYVGSAGSKKFGRGDDVTGYHFLEYAHWESPEVVGGIEEALLDNADGLIETTANGHNFFKKDWEAAKRGMNQYKAIFLPWYADEGYVKPPESEAGAPSEEEATIVKAFDLSMENIAWRRWKKRTMRDAAIFQQEYPETDEQAFLSSGRPVFDVLGLSRCREKISEPKFRGYLMRQQEKIVFINDPKGPLRVWRIPERKHVYAIGSDVAVGLEDGAYSTGEVLDIGDSEQVAEWHSHVAPELLADSLQLLSEWYNGGVIIPESFPGPGAVTNSHLVARGAKVWKDLESDHYGFHTNQATKTVMIASFNAALRDLELTIRSPELLDECHAYVYDSKMSMVPSVGNYSDRLIGMALAWHCTRDIAERVDYYKPEKPSFVQHLSAAGASVPKKYGRLPGRRSE